MFTMTHTNPKAVIYTNAEGVRVIARPCTECQNPMIPGLKSQASDLCTWCYVKVWGN